MSESNPNEVNLNPYGPGIVQKKEILSEVEQVRKQYLSHEASVKSIGILFILGGLLCIASGLSVLSNPMSAMHWYVPVIAATLILFGVAQTAVAIAVRQLKAWARIPSAVFAGVGLLAFPFGTFINAYVLYLLLSANGSIVFSPAYKEVINQTPHMKHRSTITVVMVAALIILAITFAAFALLVG